MRHSSSGSAGACHDLPHLPPLEAVPHAPVHRQARAGVHEGHPDDGVARVGLRGLGERQRIDEGDQLMSDIQVITKSRLAAYNLCARYHHNVFNLGYRSLQPRELADWGSMFHAALDAWFTVYKDHGEPLPGLALSAGLAALAEYRAGVTSIDDAAFAKAEVMLAAYDARWAPAMCEWEVLGVEVEFITMIPGRRRLRVAGKLDKLLRKRSDGSIWFGEHKTSGADLSAGSTYWVKLRMDPQVSIYHGGVRSLGYEPTGCAYDVIARPDLRPAKATPEDKRKYTKPTKTEPSRLYAGQRETDETTEEFRERLSALVAANPDAFFSRVEVVRLEREIEESAKDVEETALQIRASASAEHAPRNPNACHLYGRTCDMFDACSGVASLDDETKFVRGKVHPELSEVA
jgi:PD-(D/E)XK nuclease superfamily protein